MTHNTSISLGQAGNAYNQYILILQKNEQVGNKFGKVAEYYYQYDRDIQDNLTDIWKYRRQNFKRRRSQKFRENH